MINENYNRVLNTPSDIQHNLPILNYFAGQCEHITEMGVRAMVSTWAFLNGIVSNGTVVAIDIVNPAKYGVDIDKIAFECEREGIHLQFREVDSLETEIESTDMLFIDTIHTKKQLSKELELHASKVKKFMAFHDTALCPEVRDTINQFLAKERNWEVVFNGQLSNGLMVLQKHD